MNEEYQIEYLDKPEWSIIGGGIQSYNARQAGDDNSKSLCFVIRAPNQEVIGGVIGATYWDWLQVDLIWLKEDLRRRGYGHRLLMMAAEEARTRDARHAASDKFEFQAPELSKKY